jgi:CRISPR/Cas system-associated exonuclease Cas4 (RecB family)
MFWLKHDQKIPEPERVLKPGQTEFANDRGTRIHDNCEGYVRGDHDALCPEADKFFGFRIDMLRHFYSLGMVSLEGEWGMDKDWEIAEWKKAWLRLKLDVMVTIDPTHAIVIDYKSGRKYGNEVKHAEQLQLYALVAFLRYPKLEKITAEAWYIDQNEVTSVTFTRSQSLRFKQSFNMRGVAITTCEVFPPNPNRWSCQWCSYKNTEHCTVGV